MKQCFKDFAEFLDHLFVHAWVQLSGSAVFLAITYFGDPNRWSALLLNAGGVLFLLWAVFHAWREERTKFDNADRELHKIKETRPEAQLRFYVDGLHLCVEVRNNGGQGTFRLMLETDGPARRLDRVDAFWQPTRSVNPRYIGKDMTSWAQLAWIEEDRRTQFDDDIGEQIEPSWGWQLSYDKPPFHWWFPGSLPIGQTGGEWFTLRVLVTSDPPLLHDVVVKRLRFVDRRVIDLDSGDTFSPTVLVREDEDEGPPY